MKLSEIFRLVFINIKQSKIKAILTSLGIIVGAATIVMVVAVGEGGKRDVAEQFKSLNAGTITINSVEKEDDKFSFSFAAGDMPVVAMTMAQPMGTVFSSSEKPVNLSTDDLKNIEYFVPDIKTGALSYTNMSAVSGGQLPEKEYFSIVGTQPSYKEISNLEIYMGKFLEENNDIQDEMVAVIGSEVAETVFGSVNSAINQTITIDEKDYLVIGVLEKMGSVVSGINTDNSIFLPFETYMKNFDTKEESPTLTILTGNVNNVENIMDFSKQVLKQIYPKGHFKVENTGAIIEATMESTKTLSKILIAAAAIVFIVGGVGIMNVMFVSVKERTREIGVLKAIGTRKKDILILFVTEAIAISIIGGILGVGIGSALIPLMKYINISAVFNPISAVVAFAFAIIAGTVFGFYPAYRASKLIPIEALSSD